MKIPLVKLRAEGRILATIRYGSDNPANWSNPPKVTLKAMTSFVKLNERQITLRIGKYSESLVDQG